MNALLYIANKRKECFYENLKKLYETCPRLLRLYNIFYNIENKKEKR